MVTSQSDVISTLPELQWRGLSPVPCEDASYDFTHDQVERRYPYVDGVGHDHTGRGPIKFSVKLLFVNTLAPSLYPRTWQDWRTALFDGSAGDLIHPELGTIQARVVSGSVKLSAQNRGGITAEVTWVESIDDPDQAPADFATLSTSLQQAAAAADAACNAYAIAYPMVQDPPSMDLLSAIKSIIGQIYSAKLSVLGAINQVVGAVRQMEDTVALLAPGNDLGSATHTWPVLYNLQIVEEGLVNLRDRAQSSARPVGSLVLARSTTLDVFANQVGNTVAEVVELNPTALGKPSVPAGVPLRFYKAA